MRELIWRAIAAIVSRPAVASWLIERSKRTPYSPISSRDGTEVYMDRWWLFNAYSKDAEGNAGPARFDWLPSIRVHHIMWPDDDEHLHDHPWDARTVVLREWYREERRCAEVPVGVSYFPVVTDEGKVRAGFERSAGYTGRVLFNSYHRISEVAPGGVYTLWFTWRYQGTWGFLVDGKKVPWREYLAQRPRA
jgi:hypothetical protein